LSGNQADVGIAVSVGESVRIRWHFILSCSVVGALAQFPCGLGSDSARAATSPTDAVKVRVQSTLVASGEAPRKPVIGVMVGNPLWRIPLRAMSATRERPLFSPSRRPPRPAVVATAPPPPPPAQLVPPEPQLTLIGTVLGAGRGIGVFLDKTTKVIVRLSTGEGHDGWMLRAVQKHAVILERDRRDVTLALPGSKPTEQATASIPSAAAQEPQQETGAPPGMWRDGDGHIIKPPATKTAVDGPVAASWADGDGRLVEPPATSPAPFAPSTWRDGDGRFISAPR
jgi:hypothetical protein